MVEVCVSVPSKAFTSVDVIYNTHYSLKHMTRYETGSHVLYSGGLRKNEMREHLVVFKYLLCRAGQSCPEAQSYCSAEA